MIAPARNAALVALSDVNAGRLDLPAALTAVRPTLQDDRDRALATDLVTGTLRWQNELDYLIGEFAKRSLAKLDFVVLQILRVGAYQLVHLDRVPAAAAVNDAVQMTRRAGKTSAAGLVNAVLRAISRNTHRLPLPQRPPEGNALRYLEISLSHPAWLADRWMRRYGFDTAEKWAVFNNRPAPLTLRVNRLKIERDALVRLLAEQDVDVEPGRFAPDALIVKSGNPLRTPLANTGIFFVMDEASQLVALLAAPEAGMRVLDACASPGGKTTAMAALAGDRAHVVAADVRNARIQLLRQTVNTSGARGVRIVQADLASGLPFAPGFDIVLVDAPCSGLGTVRRDPDIRWRRQEPDLARFAAAQLVMIGHAGTAVRPGGRLVYATCSSEPDENEFVVSEFLKTNSTFRQVDLRAERHVRFDALEPVLTDAGCARLPTDTASRRSSEWFFAV